MRSKADKMASLI